ncbi:MobH family relaxase [Methylococcus sp. EFPC2]|uniref:MobH family relaxase n=1 Tax=Methylococcus sp. EFPC2 TaxID=2812648 RepID=UPI0019677039|nr:MobH family relaxase [Methylococcus sp. EFPC2]QSA98113.1 TraI domain-containing protein [Methylococcus sp. EFPC2]
MAPYAAMKSWFSLFKPPAIPTLAAVAESTPSRTDEEDIPRYPPFAKGLPAASVERILATQTELLDAIRHTLALPAEAFQTVVMPVIARYAAFTHLLPASEAHHHRGAGGLFRHGLEVAYWAVMASEGVLFGIGSTPLERKGQEPRWRLAMCLAGLLHDIGKPVSDLCILDRDGRTQWNPYLENLTDWAAKNGVDRYFLRWRDKRHQRHEQFSVLVTERVLTPECLSYLTQSGPEIMQAMLEAIAGVDRGAMFHTLVMEADRKSVERDLKANHIPVDTSLGVPVEKYLLDAMRRLIGGGRWTANTRGARVWRFADGLHVVWKAGAQEVSELLIKDRIPGIPRDPDTLADILIERGLALPRMTADGRSFRYWRMAPAELDMALYMLRLATPELIYSGEPPVVVEGRVLDETGRETVLSERDAADLAARPGTTNIPMAPTSLSAVADSAPVSEVAEKSKSDAKAEVVDPNGRADAVATPSALPSEVNPSADNGTAVGESGIRRKPRKSATAETPKSKPDNQLSRSEACAVQADEVNASSGKDSYRTTIQAQATEWLATQGQAGEWLRAAIHTSRETPELAPRIINGSVFLPHPGTARRLGQDPGESLRFLEAAGWIETDMRAPMRKVREVDGVRGILLNREASRCWLALAGEPEVAKATSAAIPNGPAATIGKPPDEAQSRMAAPASQPDNAVPAVGQVKGDPGPEAGFIKPTLTEQTKQATGEPARSATPAKTPTASPSLPLDRESEPGSAEDLIRRIRERHGVPRTITETPEGLSVPNTVLDWYVAMHPELTRSRLIIALHRHPDAQLQGNTLLIACRDVAG